MDLKIATIDGRSKEIISEAEFANKWRMFEENQSINAGTAVEVVNPLNKESYALPLRGKMDDRPGIYQSGCVYSIRYPDHTNDDQYNMSKIGVTDYSDVSSINEFLDKTEQVRNMEVVALTDADEVFLPPYSGKESPEMKAFKDAITSKQLDINRYSGRFGDNFLNDKRILKGDSITMNKLISISDNIDIEAELILRDAGPNIANPMNKEIHVILTKGGNNG